MSVPETEQAHATTEATPSTAATPAMPLAPMASITSAESTSAESVSPESGWFELPTSPARYPPTAERKNPETLMITAARIAASQLWVK